MQQNEQFQAAELPWLQRNGWMNDIRAALRWGSVKLIWWRSTGWRLPLDYPPQTWYLVLRTPVSPVHGLSPVSLWFLFPLSQKRWLTLKVTVCVCMCVCILLWSLSSDFGHMGAFDSHVEGVKTGAAWSSTWTVWCLVLEECLFLHNFSLN